MKDAITGQAREAKIQHLQSLMDGVLPTDEFVIEDLVSHAHEHELLKENYEHHTEVLKMKTNLQKLSARSVLGDGCSSVSVCGSDSPLPAEIRRIIKWQPPPLTGEANMVGFNSQSSYGMQSMLKEGHKHLSGLDEAVLKNTDAFQHPAAKILVLASKAQQEEIGDGAEELIRTVLHYSKDLGNRLSVQELLELPFISMYDDQHVDLSAYFSRAGSPLATL
ncbi:hypothetical protein KIW84_074936 [Lathyrus oleraceus]|uniref:Uncharacterized protein n=1 Tax=Pisum sativum TaxID=3888 RepID=A0A9D4VU30_PEA|nr:hypothetical protein KIW84_074936 [Pisum sativum]